MASAFDNATLATLRVIGYSIAVEPIRLVQDSIDRVVPGHTRATLHVLTEDDVPLSFDVSLEVFEKFFAVRLGCECDTD